MKKLILVLLALLIATPAICAEEKPLIKKGDKIIDFEAADLGGLKFKTEDVRKGKYFILSFFRDPDHENATGNTAPLNHIAKHFEGKAVVIELVLLDKIDEKVAINFYEKTQAVYTPAFDYDGKIAELYGVKATPVIVVADENGKVVVVFTKRFANAFFIQRTIEDEMNGVPENMRF